MSLFRSLLVALLLAATTLHAQEERPRVHLIATGGTIATLSDGSSRLSAVELRSAIPGLDSLAQLSVEQFSNVPSGSITPAHWRQLAERINELFRTQPDLAGVIVTHGTDTMEETAFFLDLTVADARPVVVTGAMRRADAIGADGPANLYNAVRLAVSPEAVGRGAMVLMNDEIFSARTATKRNTSRTHAFVPAEGGPIGVADLDAVVFYPAAPSNRAGPAFDLLRLGELPRVDIVYSYGGADGALIAAALDAGARGLVVASVGRGGTTPPQRTALQRAVDRGAVVVVSSRTGEGRVPVGSGRRADEAPSGPGVRLGAGGLNPQKARVLLMLALAEGGDAERIVTHFEGY